MVSKGDDKYVIWPIYFDKSVSKNNGRKISKKHAVEKPNIEDIAKAAKSLKLNPILEKESFYPSRNWKKEGRIIIDKKDTKSNLLRQIASHL
jgi:signal recognition particle subunit SRP19